MHCVNLVDCTSHVTSFKLHVHLVWRGKAYDQELIRSPGWSKTIVSVHMYIFC